MLDIKAFDGVNQRLRKSFCVNRKQFDNRERSGGYIMGTERFDLKRKIKRIMK